MLRLGRRIEVWLGRGRQASGAQGPRAARAGERGLCLLLRRARWCHSGPHESAASQRPGVLRPLTCPVLAMAEAASGSGDVTLEGERGKRPPPEGEPAAPASGVLGMFAAGGTETGVQGAGRGCRRRRSGSHTLACGPEAAPHSAAAAAQRAGLVNGSALGVPSAGTWTRPSDGPSLARMSLATWRLPAQGNRAIGSWVQIPCWLGDLELVDTFLGLSLVTCEMGGRTALCACFNYRSVIPRSTQGSLWAPHRLWFGRRGWALTMSKILKTRPRGKGLADAGERKASPGCGCLALESSNEGRVSP